MPSRLTTRTAMELAWVTTWVVLAVWLGYPHDWWGRPFDAFAAALLALFCVVRLRSTRPPDNWIAEGDLFAALSLLAIVPGAVGQLITGKPWLAEWSLGPPSILLGLAIASVLIRDAKLHQDARRSLADVPYPWSSRRPEDQRKHPGQPT